MRIAYRIIPRERKWLVMPIVGGVVLDEPISKHTSRSKAWNSVRGNFFKHHTGRRPFKIILEVNDELET